MTEFDEAPKTRPGMNMSTLLCLLFGFAHTSTTFSVKLEMCSFSLLRYTVQALHPSMFCALMLAGVCQVHGVVGLFPFLQVDWNSRKQIAIWCVAERPESRPT